MALKKTVARSAMAAIAAITLLTSTSVPAIAAGSNTSGTAQSNTVVAPKIIRLNESSQLFIRNVYMLNQAKGKVMAFTATLTNNGSKELDLNDYMIRVKTKSGKSFKATLTEAGNRANIIPAKTSKNLTYFVLVDQQTKTEDILFEIVMWDFNAPNYERHLGVVGYPFSFSENVQPFKDKVLLYDNTKLRSAIKQVMISRDESYSYMTINFLLENVGFQTTDLSKARFALQTESMTVFDLDAGDLSQITIQPQERKIVTLNAQIPISVAGRKMDLVGAIEDATNGVRIPLGTFEMPNVQVSPATPALQPKLLYVSGNPITHTLGQAFTSESDQGKSIVMEYTFLNESTAAVTLPDLEFTLKDKDGTSYPLTYELEDKRLLPKIEKTITLTGEIPSTLDPNAVQMVVRTAPAGGKNGSLVGIFNVMTGSNQGNVESAFVHNGYEIKVNAIQRIPSSVADVVAADLLIKNNTAQHKAIPSFSGYFLINGVKVNAESFRVALDNSISIAPGETYNLVVYTQIPYTTSIDTIQFALTDAANAQQAKTLYRFSSNGIAEIGKKSIDAIYEIEGVGRKSAVNIYKAGLYDNEKEKVMYVELDYENKESRAGTVVPISGYVSNVDGEIYDLQFTNYTGKIKANGKVILSGWAVLPKEFSNQDVELVIGQSVKGNAGDSNDAQENVIVKAQGFELKEDRLAGTQNSLINIPFHQYRFSMRNIYLNLGASPQGNQIDGLTLTFNYDLGRDAEARETAEAHKLILEIVNQDTKKATFSTEFEFDTLPGSNSLKEGTGFTKTVTFQDNDISSKIDTYGSYVLNVYDQIGEQKIRLATKELRWFRTEQ